MFVSKGELRLHRGWWLALHINDDLGSYYRHLFNQAARFQNIQIKAPKWGEHISIVRGEEPPHMWIWQSLHGKSFEFKYNTELQTNGKHVWLNVDCEPLKDIRKQLGLPRNPDYPLHLTVGAYFKAHSNDETRLLLPGNKR